MVVGGGAVSMYAVIFVYFYLYAEDTGRYKSLCCVSMDVEGGRL